MKCLTVCEPYASLICLPDSDPRAKRVENRRWYTSYRGPLLIHAGKSRTYLDPEMSNPWPDGFGMTEADLMFGAILGVCDLIACIDSDRIIRGDVPDNLSWLREHQHVEGPFCFVLANVRRLDPIPYKGAQGFFDVPDELLEQIGRKQKVGVGA